MVNVSLPEAATQFGYRVGDKGDFTDPGFLDVLDQRTGARMPKTFFEMAPDQGKTKIYITWRDKRGEQADVTPINFDPTAALADEQKKILDQFWTSWIAFREYNGMLVYFTHLVAYRCAIKEVRYGFGDGPVDKVFKLPPCDAADPHSVPGGATLYMKVPPKTASMQVPLPYVDGTISPARVFVIGAGVAGLQAPASSWSSRWQWARCWTQRSANTKARQPARTACSARCTIR